MGRRTWVKIYCDKWLRGSMRGESPAIRGIFIDLLALAGDSAYGDSGFISLAENCGITNEQFCSILNINDDIWRTAKDRLIETGRISINGHNEIQIINWKKYQSEYERTKKYKKKYGQKYKEKEKEKEKENNNIIYIWDLYKNLFKEYYKPRKLTPTRKKKIKTRLESFSIKEGEVILKNISQDEFMVGNNQDNKFYATPEYCFRNDEIWEKWLNKKTYKPKTIKPSSVLKEREEWEKEFKK